MTCLTVIASSSIVHKTIARMEEDAEMLPRPRDPPPVSVDDVRDQMRQEEEGGDR